MGTAENHNRYDIYEENPYRLVILNATMSSDPATFVAGIPAKIGERFRPPRRITLPASCNHTVNTELLVTEYDFVCEKSTLTWIEEKRKRKEREEEERRLEEERQRQLKI